MAWAGKLTTVDGHLCFVHGEVKEARRLFSHTHDEPPVLGHTTVLLPLFGSN